MKAAFGRFLERRGPTLVAVLVFVTAWANSWFVHLPKDFSVLLQATINVAAIAVGFLAAAKGILISSHDRQIIQLLKEAKQLLPLIDYFIAATFWCGGLCIVSAWLLVIDVRPNDVMPRITVVTWISLLAGSAAACFRVIYLFNTILRTMSK